MSMPPVDVETPPNRRFSLWGRPNWQTSNSSSGRHGFRLRVILSVWDGEVTQRPMPATEVGCPEDRLFHEG